MASLYKRGGNPIWWGRVQANGHEHRRSMRTSNRAEAKERLAAWAKDIEAQAYFGIERRTWDDAQLAFVTSPPSDIRPSTLARYMVSFRAVFPLLTGTPLQKIDRRAISRIGNRPGVTNATRRRDLTAVSAVLRNAKRMGWIERNPVADFERNQIRERRDPIVLPPEHEVSTFIAACHESTRRGTLGYLAELLLSTGMRLEEAGSLTWRQVDLNRRACQLVRTKSGRPRAVSLTGTAVRTLEGIPRALGCPWVFWHSEGLRYANLSSRFRAIKCRLGFRWRTHDLRHLYAVRAIQSGVSIYTIQQQLGHGSLKQTEGYLAFLTPEEATAARANAS